jgi:DNA polymerase III subunit delta
MPGLTLDALKKRIAEHKLERVHVFVGEDVRLVDQLVDAVEATVDPADRPFAVERVYAGDAGGTPLDIAASARVFPMLGDRRIVIVLRAEKFLKPKRKAAATEDPPADVEAEAEESLDFAALEEYVQKPVDSTTLLFVATEIDRSRRFTKRLLEAKHVLVTEFAGLVVDAGMGRRALSPGVAAFVQEEFQRAGRTIEPEASRQLASRAGGDITKLRGDVERLLLFAGDRKKITADDVMEVTSASTNVEDEWAVVNAISDGDVARALREAGRRMERGDSPHALVGQLRWWVSSRLAEADGARVKPALEALLRTDLALKSSGGEDRILVERLVVELTGKPVAQRGGWRG